MFAEICFDIAKAFTLLKNEKIRFCIVL